MPSFHIPVSDLVPALVSQGQPVTAYSLDAYFEGTSVFWGYQLGASYEINDMFSVYLGARYISVKNTYAGHLTDVNITLGGTETSASGFFASSANALQPMYDGLSGISAASFGGLTLDEAYGAGIIPDLATYTALAGGYAMFGLSPATNTVDEGITTISPSYLGARRAEYVLADQDDVEVEQTGSGITPIIGVNISPNDKLNIGLKYEMKTEIEIENKTTTDFIIDYDYLTNTETGMFPDGVKTRSDMPAMFAAGLDYKITDKLSVASGFHMYFDKNADYGRKLYDPTLGESVHVDNDEVIDRNSTEFALGFEYIISDKLLLSIGYLNTQTGVTEDYQTDLSWSQHSNTIGFGGKYAVTPAIDLDLGIGYTIYNDARKIYTEYNSLGQQLMTTEEYDKD
ncbi:OmpP1/FadL family transporter, partial [Bacteroidota bacterium]